MFKRKLLKSLIDRKNRKRKPLILYWARQVWKTTLVDMFWVYFKKYHKLNFQANPQLCKIFEWSIEWKSVIKKLEIFLWKDIDPYGDLIFFDEIQDCPAAINSLKFLQEDFPHSYIIAAWSYLWLVRNQTNFPVWKIETLTLYPLDFEEFLEAVDSKLYEFYKDIKVWEKIDDFIHEKLIERFRLYLFIWWMPEIIQSYVNGEDIVLIRKKQKDLLDSYKWDFSKYSWFINALHVLYVFESVVSQLWQAQDESVKKFKFSWVIPKKKWFNDLIWPLTFLEKSNLIIKSYIVNWWKHPLKAYVKSNYFKLYFFDVGLLNAALNIHPRDILLDSINFYKWFIVENFVACELKSALNDNLISWQEGNAEIEFLLETKYWVVPLEVKSSKKYRRSKSLDSFIQKYSPKFAYKLTLESYYKSNRWFEVVPLYLVKKIFEKLF